MCHVSQLTREASLHGWVHLKLVTARVRGKAQDVAAGNTRARAAVRASLPPRRPLGTASHRVETASHTYHIYYVCITLVDPWHFYAIVKVLISTFTSERMCFLVVFHLLWTRNGTKSIFFLFVILLMWIFHFHSSILLLLINVWHIFEWSLLISHLNGRSHKRVQ